MTGDGLIILYQNLSSFFLPGTSSITGAYSVLLKASEKPPKLKYFDRLAAAVTVVLFFVILFVFAVFETYVSSLLSNFYYNHCRCLYLR